MYIIKNQIGFLEKRTRPEIWQIDPRLLAYHQVATKLEVGTVVVLYVLYNLRSLLAAPQLQSCYLLYIINLMFLDILSGYSNYLLPLLISFSQTVGY